jgi:uncharacterized membrane protein YdjX (TVP38/TMEM64 family)
MRFDLKTVSRAAGVAVPIVFGIVVGRLLSPFLPQFVAWVHTLGAWAPFAFLGAYLVVCVLMLPAFLLIMAAGAVFGMVKGTALALVGATLGGTVAFLIGRYIAREQVAKRVAKNPTLATIDRVIGEDGLRLVFLLRLSPAVPFVLTNYALGVTRVRLRDFMLGTVGLTPIMLAYAGYGSASGAGPRADGSSPVSAGVLALGFVATVILVVFLTRIAQKAIAEAEAAKLKLDAPHAASSVTV